MYYVVLGCFWSYLVEVLDALVNLNVERIRGRFVEVVGAITTPPTFKTHLVGISGLDRNPPGVYQVFLRPDVLNHISVLKHRIYSLYILRTKLWWWWKREELKMADLLLQFRGKGVKMGGGGWALTIYWANSPWYPPKVKTLCLEFTSWEERRILTSCDTKLVEVAP